MGLCINIPENYFDNLHEFGIEVKSESIMLSYVTTKTPYEYIGAEFYKSDIKNLVEFLNKHPEYLKED